MEITQEERADRTFKRRINFGQTLNFSDLKRIKRNLMTKNGYQTKFNDL